MLCFCPLQSNIIDLSGSAVEVHCPFRPPSAAAPEGGPCPAPAEAAPGSGRPPEEGPPGAVDDGNRAALDPPRSPRPSALSYGRECIFLSSSHFFFRPFVVLANSPRAVPIFLVAVVHATAPSPGPHPAAGPTCVKQLTETRCGSSLSPLPRRVLCSQNEADKRIPSV